MLLDPIEAAAIGAVFGEYRSPTDPLYCGSVKANIGHLEGGSGIAGVMKSILILEKGAIPPNAGFERVNPNIKADALNLKAGLSNRGPKYVICKPPANKDFTNSSQLSLRPGIPKAFVGFQSTHSGLVVLMPMSFWMTRTIISKNVV
jgi:hypothetical protein